jgi:hypothetical protein
MPVGIKSIEGAFTLGPIVRIARKHDSEVNGRLAASLANGSAHGLKGVLRGIGYC